MESAARHNLKRQRQELQRWCKITIWVWACKLGKIITSAGWQVHDLCVYTDLDDIRADLCIMTVSDWGKLKQLFPNSQSQPGSEKSAFKSNIK